MGDTVFVVGIRNNVGSILNGLLGICHGSTQASKANHRKIIESVSTGSQLLTSIAQMGKKLRKSLRFVYIL